MMSPFSLLALFAWFSIAAASVQFITPQEQAVLDVNSPIDIEWSYPENATSYLVGTEYSIYLCAGGNDKGSHVRWEQAGCC